MKVLDSEEAADAEVDALEEAVDVVGQLTAISESSAEELVVVDMVEDSADPQHRHMAVDSEVLPQLLPTAEVLVMAELVAMVEEATATHLRAVDNLGGRLHSSTHLCSFSDTFSTPAQYIDLGQRRQRISTVFLSIQTHFSSVLQFHHLLNCFSVSWFCDIFDFLVAAHSR